MTRPATGVSRHGTPSRPGETPPPAPEPVGKPRWLGELEDAPPDAEGSFVEVMGWASPGWHGGSGILANGYASPEVVAACTVTAYDREQTLQAARWAQWERAARRFERRCAAAPQLSLFDAAVGR